MYTYLISPRDGQLWVPVIYSNNRNLGSSLFLPCIFVQINMICFFIPYFHWLVPLLFQWEFQDPKMKVLYHVRPYFVGGFPYIALKQRPSIWYRL